MLEHVTAPEPFAPLFEKAQEFVSDHFESLKRDPSKGTIDIMGERYIMIRAGAMSVEFFGLIQRMYSEKDRADAEDFARNLLFDVAHAIGISDAKAFHEKMNLTDPVDRLSAGPLHFAHSGWAYVDILPESRPAPDESYFLKYHHPYSFESDAWIQSGSKPDFPVCFMNAGYSSGWYEESFGMPLVATELSCRACGDDNCTFIMAPPDKLEGYIHQHIRNNPQKRIHAVFEVPELFSRKKAEDQARQMAAEWSASFDAIQDHVCIIDTNFRIKRVNQAFASFAGQDPESLCGKPFADFYSQGDYQFHENALEQPIKTGKPVTLCLMHPVRDHFFEITVNPIRDNDKQITSLVNIARDVTERHQVDCHLRENEARLKSIFSSVLTGIALIEAQTHTIVDINPVAEEMIGLPRDDILGKVCHSFICPAEVGKCPITDLGQEIERSERVLVRADGSQIPVLKTVRLLTLNGKKYILDSFMDISALKDTEKQIQEKNRFLDTLVDTIPAPIFYKSAGGKYLACNRAFENFIGTTRERILGKTVYDISPPDVARQYDLKDRELFDNPGNQTYQSKVKHQDGRMRDVIFYKATYENETGDVGGLIGTFMDITDRIETEEKNRKADKLTSLGRLVEGISHELNNPLTGIIGYAQVLSNRTGLEHIAKELSRINTAALCCRDIVEGMMQFTKLMNPTVRECDLHDIIGNALRILSQRMNNAGIDLTTDYCADLPLIQGDFYQLQNAIENLLVNAIQSIEDTGKPGSIKIHTARTETTVVMSISDSGTPVPQHIQDRIFDPFFTTRKTGEGVGLGLSVAHGILEQHNGTIQLRSSTDEKTVFEITLPLE